MSVTTLFLDTEFSGLHQKSTLISLAIVEREDAYLYVEFDDFDKKQISPWVEENVIAHLSFKENSLQKDAEKWIGRGNSTEIRTFVQDYLSQFEKVEIWSDVGMYDWVLFCNLFGDAFSIPNNVFFIPFDMATAFKINGIDPNVKREEWVKADNSEVFNNLKLPQHHALKDAQILRLCYKKIFSKKIK